MRKSASHSIYPQRVFHSELDQVFTEASVGQKRGAMLLMGHSFPKTHASTYVCKSISLPDRLRSLHSGIYCRCDGRNWLLYNQHISLPFCDRSVAVEPHSITNRVITRR